CVAKGDVWRDGKCVDQQTAAREACLARSGIWRDGTCLDREQALRQALEMLRRGDPNDVVLLVNETSDAPNARRDAQGQVGFRDGQATVCGVTPWTSVPDVGAAIRVVLARHGAARVLTEAAQ